MLKITPDKSISNTLQRRYVYGLAGLANLIGCSYQTALKIKDSGKIPFGKIGKKFIFDEEKVLAAISSGKGAENE